MPNLNLTLNERAWEILEELSKRTGKKKSEIMRNALTLMYLAEKESRNNRSLAFINDETNEAVTKLVNIF